MPVSARRVAALAALPTVIMTGVGVAAAAGPGEAPRTAAAVTTPAYEGSAFGLKAQLVVAASSILDEVLPEIVKYPSGGDKSLLELPTELSETATLKVLNASSIVKDGVLRSNARTAGLSVLADLVTAAVLNADCTADQLKLTGDSQVTDLRIAGIKVPIDPGPNFKVEIPDALKPFLSGGIYIDEQDTLKDKSLRVRALHVRLVIDPLGLEPALQAIVAEVRAAAEKVKVVLEEATGETLATLVSKERAARAALTGSGAGLVGTPTAGTPTTRRGANAERNDARAEFAQRDARDAAEREADEAERIAREKESAVVAAERRAAAARAAAAPDGVAVESEAAAPAQAERTAKSDRAQIAREAESERESRGNDEAEGTEEARGNDDAEGAQEVRGNDEGAPVKADGAEAQAAAERAAAREVDEPTDATQTTGPTLEQAEAEAVLAQSEATEARKAANAARARADAFSERPAAQAAAAHKADGASADQAKPAAPAADDEETLGGTLGVDVIVSQVNCKGAALPKQVKAATKPKAVQEENKAALPNTGGDGHATDLGAAGLGLLLAGSAAVYLARRRGRHAA